MRTLFSFLIAGMILWGVAGVAAEKKPQEKLVFKATMGNVTFLHAKHAERDKGDCKVCHDTLFKQDLTVALGFKGDMHKTAVAKKTGCAAAACHNTGGKAFVTTGNCTKCHVKTAAKS